LLERLFRLSENDAKVKTELLAGMTTFLTMAYIIFVQPAVLTTDFAGKPTGLDKGAVLLATCVVSALASIFMGLYARYPIALAPGMGENFFFVSVIMALGAQGVPDPWQAALAIVLVSGILFLILTILRTREAIINAISPSMRNAIAVGIGLFIAFIGLQHGKVIVSNPGSMVTLNTAGNADHLASIAVFFFGLIVAGAFQARQVRGAVLWGILFAAALAAILGRLQLPDRYIGFPRIEQHAAFHFDFKHALTWGSLPFIIIFLFMDMFDTIGTLIGVSEQAGFIKNNKLPRANRALLVDAVGTVSGACLGTSTVTSYIESATGVAYGGRTGLTAVTTGLLFLLALIFSPIIAVIAGYAPITAPALFVVGALMMSNVRKIDWDDFSESIPAFLTIVGIPLCYSIADGLALGFITQPIVKLMSGRGREVGWLMYVLAVVLFAYLLLVRAKLLFS